MISNRHAFLGSRLGTMMIVVGGVVAASSPTWAESTISSTAIPSPNITSASSTAAEALREAEAALQSVDYAAVYDRARRGLELGRATARETTRLSVLAGLAAALLGHSEQARTYFIKALAIQPSLKLEHELSPKMREPYLEALGYWGSQPTRLSLSVKIDEQTGVLSFRLDDPAQLSRNLTCFLRIGDSDTFVPQTLGVHSRGRFALPKSAVTQGYSYYLELTDEYGNRLLEHASDDEPVRVAPRLRAAESQQERTTTVPPAHERHSVRWALPIALMGTGLAAAGAGVYFNVRREDLAERWNGNACEQPGQSRGAQCADVQRDRATMERLAIAGYAIGGALLVTGAGVIYFGSTREGKEPGTTSFGRCGVSPMGALYCQGRF